MKYIKLSALFVAFLMVITACTGIYEDGAELAKQEQERVELITVDELNKKIENGDDFLLIDVRQPNDYYTANIDGSVLIPRGELEFKIANEDFWFEQFLYPPEDTTEIIIYCKSGKRATLASVALLQLGYKDVKNLEGGYDAFNPDQDPNAKPQASSGGCGG